MITKVKAKGRKIGRNKAWCLIYSLSNKREQNKCIKIARHIKRYGPDACAEAALDRLALIVPKHVRAVRI